jgi:molybdenum cofactor cytidylyltransferase
MSAWAAAGIAAVVLAAGRSSRMAGGSKLLLPHPRDGAPLVRHAVLGALALEPLETVVVVRPDLPDLAAALIDLPVRLAPNPDYQEGMASSLRAGIAALGPESAAALVLLGDTPDVDPAVFAALLAAYQAEGRPITQPVFGGTPGPPTLFARAAFPALARLTGDQGGRQLIARHPDWLTRVPLPAALQPPDVDTWEDYQAFAGT